MNKIIEGFAVGELKVIECGISDVTEYLNSLNPFSDMVLMYTKVCNYVFGDIVLQFEVPDDFNPDFLLPAIKAGVITKMVVMRNVVGGLALEQLYFDIRCDDDVEPFNVTNCINTFIYLGTDK